MKSQNLIRIALTGCVLVGASGAAMAVEECDSGAITGEVNDDIVIDGRSCVINDAMVSGTIDVKNAEDITIVGSEVVGRVRIQDSRTAVVVLNRAQSNIVVKNNESAVVTANVVSTTIRVSRNVLARVKQNASLAIVCTGNSRLDSVGNQAEEENCRS